MVGTVALGNVAAASASVLSGAVAQVVVGDSAVLTVGDQVFVDELGSLGFATTLVDDSTAADVGSGPPLVVISPTASGTLVSTKYTNVAVSVVSFNVDNWNDLGLTTATGSVYNTSNLLTVDGTSPLLKNLGSTFAVTTGSEPLASANAINVPSSVDTVAVRSAVTSAAVVLSLGSGGSRADGSPAPSGRAAVGLTEAALEQISDDGLTLVDNAILWANDQSSSVAANAVGSIAQRGLWKLDEAGSPPVGPPATNVIKDGAGSDPGNFPAFGLTPGPSVTLHSAPVAVVSSGAGHSYYFPGWRDDFTSGGQVRVDPYASSARIPNQANGLLDVGRVPPKTAGSSTKPVFSASLYFIADDMSSVIGTAWSTGGASPNLLQKGLAAHNGQWKISMEPLTSPVRAADPQFGMNCSFQGQTEDSSGAVLQTNQTHQVATPQQLKPAIRYKGQCDLLLGGLAQVTVSSVDQFGGLTRVYKVQESAADAYTTSYYRVTSCSDVWFGKKGGGAAQACYTPTADTIDDAHDSFRGPIDNISISS